MAAPLKYLFLAVYKDGSIFEQNPEDVSYHDPKRSAFFDVKQDQLASFSLVGAEHTYLVDLQDGHFEVDGVPFRFHEHRHTEPLRLVFFRRHRHSVNAILKDGQTRLDPASQTHTMLYRLGWQTTAGRPKGENYQEVMELD